MIYSVIEACKHRLLVTCILHMIITLIMHGKQGQHSRVLLHLWCSLYYSYAVKTVHTDNRAGSISITYITYI
jgi:hypothetical protein